MALPLIATLPKTARIAYPIIWRGTREGLSSRQIERVVRQAGLQISRPRSILPIMRELRAIEAHAANLRFVPKNLTINTARLPHSLTRMNKQFAFWMRVRGRDAFGNLVDRHVTVSTDRRIISPQELEDTATQFVSEEGQSDTLTEATALLDFAVQRKPRSL